MGKYDYVGIYEKHGVEVKFTASSLQKLATQMEVSYPTVQKIHKNNGVPDPNQRLPIKVFRYEKKPNFVQNTKSLRITTDHETEIEIERKIKNKNLLDLLN